MKYLLLKHYRGGPAPAVNYAPMDQWSPQEVDAHMKYMHDFAARLEETGEFVDSQALAPEGTFVRYDGEGRPTAPEAVQSGVPETIRPAMVAVLPTCSITSVTSSAGGRCGRRYVRASGSPCPRSRTKDQLQLLFGLGRLFGIFENVAHHLFEDLVAQRRRKIHLVGSRVRV